MLALVVDALLTTPMAEPTTRTVKLLELLVTVPPPYEPLAVAVLVVVCVSCWEQV